MKDKISLRWTHNDLEAAKSTFGGGRETPEFTYCGAPINADFELTYENLVPFVTETLDQAAEVEAVGLSVKLIEIKNGKVKVW